MAVLRKSKTRKPGNSWGRIWQCLLGSQQRKSRDLKPRHLAVDMLEARTLLSVSPAGVSDTLINQVFTVSQGAEAAAEAPLASQDSQAAKAVACDNNGDFVVTWERNDPTGIYNPTTGAELSDYNIYARYFTQAMQTVKLPTLANGTLNTSDLVKSNGTYYFALQYNGNEVQKLSLSAGNAPFVGSSSIIGNFDLTFNGQTVSSVGYDQDYFNTGYFDGDFTSPYNDPAMNFQAALRSLGGPLADVTVQAQDATDFSINFGDDSGGVQQPLIGVANTNFTNGFYPAVQVTMQRTPEDFLIPLATTATANGPIMTAANAATTAANIAYAFQQNSQNYVEAPVFFPPDSSITTTEPIAAYYTPEWEQGAAALRTASPAVSVVADPNPTTPYQFDVTFTGDEGYQDQPLMMVDNATTGAQILGLTTIVKQSSNEFRVNDPEVNDPTSMLDSRTDQENPQVAMAPDGSFVITWQSVVAGAVAPNSVTDISARRFEPAGWVVDSYRDITFTPTNGTSATGQFTLTTSLGTTPSITFDSTNLQATATAITTDLQALGFDPATTVSVENSGPSSYDLRITWGGDDVGTEPMIQCSSVVDSSGAVEATAATSSAVPFYANMDPDGLGIPNTPIESVVPVAGQFQVNTIQGLAQTNPSIGVDGSGNFTIAWQTEGQSFSYFNDIEAQRYNYLGQPLGAEFTVDTGAPSTSVNVTPYVAMSNDGVIAIAWENSTNVNTVVPILYGTTAEVDAQVYAANGTVVVPDFGCGQDLAGQPAIAFDLADNFVITGESSDAKDDLNGNDTDGSVYAVEYQLYTPGTKTLNFQQIRADFRADSTSSAADGTNPGAGGNEYWPGEYLDGQPVIDADGDLTIAYDGPTPAVSETVDLLGGLNAAQELTESATTDLENQLYSQTITFSGGSAGQHFRDGDYIEYYDATSGQFAYGVIESVSESLDGTTGVITVYLDAATPFATGESFTDYGSEYANLRTPVFAEQTATVASASSTNLDLAPYLDSEASLYFGVRPGYEHDGPRCDHRQHLAQRRRPDSGGPHHHHPARHRRSTRPATDASRKRGGTVARPGRRGVVLPVRCQRHFQSARAEQLRHRQREPRRREYGVFAVDRLGGHRRQCYRGPGYCRRHTAS